MENGGPTFAVLEAISMSRLWASPSCERDICLWLDGPTLLVLQGWTCLGLFDSTISNKSNRPWGLFTTSGGKWHSVFCPDLCTALSQVGRLPPYYILRAVPFFPFFLCSLKFKGADLAAAASAACSDRLALVWVSPVYFLLFHAKEPWRGLSSVILSWKERPVGCTALFGLHSWSPPARAPAWHHCSGSCCLTSGAVAACRSTWGNYKYCNIYWDLPLLF